MKFHFYSFVPRNELTALYVTSIWSAVEYCFFDNCQKQSAHNNGTLFRQNLHHMNNKNEKTRIVVSLIFIGCIGITFMQPLAQDPAYHSFADARSFCGISNFWNVVSNLPFLLAGLLGIGKLLFPEVSNVRKRPAYLMFFLGIALTGLGSGWYHLHPDNTSLVWDRLPMAVSFMSFFSIIISEYIDEKKGKLLLIPLLMIGIFSVLYWHYTELQGHGDLRFYILVQFLPMLLIPLVMLLFRPAPPNAPAIWLMLLAYALSKFFETSDHLIFDFTPFLSGHTLKHFFAASAPFIFLYGIRK
ncbi:MAG: hypothetical protein JWO44_2359 [Bacteroidetes bacterium]|nr:hypothetical protein [Bacteroidota bacterium]